MSPKRAQASLTRSTRTRPERRRILIVTEGEKTEPAYFKGLAKLTRATAIVVVSVRVDGLGRDPESVVRRVIRWTGLDDDFDEYWAVVDVDDHTTLTEAIRLAKAHALPLAITNECFELWLLWHYEDCTRHSSRNDLNRRLESHGFSTEKDLPPDFPFQGHADACHRSVAAAPDLGLGEKGPNPSSSVHFLVARVVAAGP
jgi:hypothetical protein